MATKPPRPPWCSAADRKPVGYKSEWIPVVVWFWFWYSHTDGPPPADPAGWGSPLILARTIRLRLLPQVARTRWKYAPPLAGTRTPPAMSSGTVENQSLLRITPSCSGLAGRLRWGQGFTWLCLAEAGERAESGKWITPLGCWQSGGNCVP